MTAYPPHAVARAQAFAVGTAFFPVGAGLWWPGTPLAERPIALIAHVFDEASYRFALGAGEGSERVAGNRTWAGLRRVLALADADIADCFLTNALMGIKVGPATGAVRAGVCGGRTAAARRHARLARATGLAPSGTGSRRCVGRLRHHGGHRRCVAPAAHRARRDTFRGLRCRHRGAPTPLYVDERAAPRMFGTWTRSRRRDTAARSRSGCRWRS